MPEYDDLLARLKRVPDISYREAYKLLTHKHTPSKSRCMDNLQADGRIEVFMNEAGQRRVREGAFNYSAPKKGKLTNIPMRIKDSIALLRFTILMAEQHYDHSTRMEMMNGIRAVILELEPYIEALDLLRILSLKGASARQYAQLTKDMEKNRWMTADYETFERIEETMKVLFGQLGHELEIPSQYAGLNRDFWINLQKMGTQDT